MGTNYYLHTTPCVTCGHSAAKLHIGNSSSGWNFALRVYTDKDKLVPFGVQRIQELDDWKPLFANFRIVDEHDQRVTSNEIIKTITKRAHPFGTPLLSHLGIVPKLQVKAGAGTYDLCAYEFE